MASGRPDAIADRLRGTVVRQRKGSAGLTRGVTSRNLSAQISAGCRRAPVRREPCGTNGLVPATEHLLHRRGGWPMAAAVALSTLDMAERDRLAGVPVDGARRCAR